MNRALRLRLRRRAAEMAREYVASGIVIAGLCGGVARLEHPTARRIVREELFRMMRDAGRPRLRRLDQDEAQCFPFMREPVAGAVPWLAVGLDVDGRATVLTRWLPAASAGDGEAACAMRLALLAALDAERGRSGLPMPREMEGRA
jgi:hypothetical protein